MDKSPASCGHPEYRDGHCAEMVCRNYAGKCTDHSKHPKAEVEEIKVAACSNCGSQALHHVLYVAEHGVCVS